jgi:hypothetical protein
VLNLKHLHDLVQVCTVWIYCCFPAAFLRLLYCCLTAALLLQGCTDEFLVFGLSHTQTVVLRRDETIRSTEDILKQHGISCAKSSEFF